jgi:LPXTG-site transpeptidase (sortase) family protein
VPKFPNFEWSRIAAGSLLISAIIMTGTPANAAISRISRTHPAPPHRAHTRIHARAQARGRASAHTRAGTHVEHEAHELHKAHEAHKAYEAHRAHRAGRPRTTAAHKTAAKPGTSGQATAARKTAKTRASAPKWQLDIPDIGVLSTLMVLGDHHGNELPVPPLADAGSAAWYEFTVTPGSPGNAVVVGHVDTHAETGVFYDLYLLRRGDPIYVRMGGKRLRFAVASVQEVPKQRFPVDRVFGPTTARRLWLITCGGDFDYTTRHYLDNIVVSATYQPTHHDEHQ